MKDDVSGLRPFDARRRVPAPKGWRPAGTATGDPRLLAAATAGLDPRFDGGPSRRPYPEGMPTLNTVSMSGPTPTIDVHTRALRAAERRVHEGLVIFEDESSRTRDAAVALAWGIHARKALREELSVGVVELSAREREVLDFVTPPDAGAYA